MSKVHPFAAARLRASNLRPYFRQAYAAVTPVPVPGLGTMAVDKYWRVYYDPTTTENWGAAAAAVLTHEIGHPLRQHHQRAESIGADLDAELWNQCTDAEINDDGFDDELKLPDGGGVQPRDLGCEPGSIAEIYYQHCKRSRRQGADQGSAGGSKGTSDSGSNPGSGGPSSSAGKSTVPGKGTSPGQPRARAANKKNQPNQPQSTVAGQSCSAEDAPPSRGGCGGGSGVDGIPRPWELPPDDKNYPGLSQVEAQLVARAVARDILDAAKMAGKIPGNWKRWAQSTLEPPKVPWTQQLASVLRGQLSASGVQDYSYSRPSRRGSAVPRAVLPAMRARKPKIGIVVDTSGSMSSQDISEACSEVEGICRAHQSDVLFAAVDAAVHTRARINSARRIDLTGGGGTDMRVGIDEMVRAKVDVVIVLTDGYTPWPDSPPSARVVVCLVGSSADKASVPTWAKAIVRKDRQ